MGVVGWAIVLALPVYALAQLALLIVLGRRFALEGDAPPRPGGRTWTEESAGGEAQAPADPTDSVECRACGAENEPGYAFCRGCVTRLGTG